MIFNCVDEDKALAGLAVAENDPARIMFLTGLYYQDKMVAVSQNSKW